MASVGILAKDASSTDGRFHGILLLREKIREQIVDKR